MLSSADHILSHSEATLNITSILLSIEFLLPFSWFLIESLLIHFYLSSESLIDIAYLLSRRTRESPVEIPFKKLLELSDPF